jgi:hypothetical protein
MANDVRIFSLAPPNTGRQRLPYLRSVTSQNLVPNPIVEENNKLKEALKNLHLLGTL